LFRDLIFERAYGASYPRSLCDDYFQAVTKGDTTEPLKPIIYSEQHEAFLFFFQKHNLVYMIASKQEAPALLFARFLEHTDHVLCDFFGEAKLEQRVRIHFVYLFMVCCASFLLLI
jgi:hypothetical protein